jgi:hypothetical protein
MDGYGVYQAYHETLKGTPEALKYLETRGPNARR